MKLLFLSVVLFLTTSSISFAKALKIPEFKQPDHLQGIGVHAFVRYYGPNDCIGNLIFSQSHMEWRPRAYGFVQTSLYGKSDIWIHSAFESFPREVPQIPIGVIQNQTIELSRAESGSHSTAYYAVFNGPFYMIDPKTPFFTEQQMAAIQEFPLIYPRENPNVHLRLVPQKSFEEWYAAEPPPLGLVRYISTPQGGVQTLTFKLVSDEKDSRAYLERNAWGNQGNRFKFVDPKLGSESITIYQTGTPFEAKYKQYEIGVISPTRLFLGSREEGSRVTVSETAFLSGRFYLLPTYVKPEVFKNYPVIKSVDSGAEYRLVPRNVMDYYFDRPEN